MQARGWRRVNRVALALETEIARPPSSESRRQRARRTRAEGALRVLARRSRQLLPQLCQSPMVRRLDRAHRQPSISASRPPTCRGNSEASTPHADAKEGDTPAPTSRQVRARRQHRQRSSSTAAAGGAGGDSDRTPHDAQPQPEGSLTHRRRRHEAPGGASLAAPEPQPIRAAIAASDRAVCVRGRDARRADPC